MPLVAKPLADPHAIFAPFSLPDAPNVYRAGSGVPGPHYWQNQVDYKIKAHLDAVHHRLNGDETITYTNNSPDTLDVVWLQLEQNRYRADSRSNIAGVVPSETSEGMVLEKVCETSGGIETGQAYLVSDTRLQLKLSHAILPHQKVNFRIQWHYTIPGTWGGRTAVSKAQDGDVFEMAQWYPRLSVYDDRRGWNTLPYLEQEFFLEYGNFDYSVTVPWNFTVVGSGALLNPVDVLTETERARLTQAAGSEKRILIRDLHDVTTPSSHKKLSGEATWHFAMQNTRDVSFATSPAFLWDAERINLPDVSPWPGYAKQPRLAMSVYPREGISPHGWDRSTDYVKHAIEYFSSQWFVYPWPNAINVGGYGAGMEYPGIVFDGMHERDPELFWITTHEIGHDWFPMLVGTDERRNAFMDEGFNTFIDAYASDHFNHGEFAPKKDPEFSPQTGNPAHDIVPVLQDSHAPSLMMAADDISETYRHSISYFKGAYGLKLLREQILGPQRFDAAFRRYIAEWAYRHPSPSDFFRIMESEGGEDLGWFWRGWYFENAAPDYAVTMLKMQTNGQVKVGVANYGNLPLPVHLRLQYADGTMSDRILPTETWRQDSAVVLTLPVEKKVVSATLDPDVMIPDVDRSDNTLAVSTAHP
ncbi:M1 family metallopeptidase [Neokomagataea anthophila]|uniref:M1 family metallopeptidase n=1 Tax=Neokomagataea anthophila TaxID=2826925 RepID=A0ABS5E8T4_9PROT|nr:M1 family metallopeptidase [Neokomagataea anthophila]MBR0560321.1 M1 family metallopeptidase [Neokomagataea anthophila]